MEGLKATPTASSDANLQPVNLDLIKRVGGCGQVAELRLPLMPGQRPPSMNWMLNSASREQIDAALLEKWPSPEGANAPSAIQLSQQLRQARNWLLQMK